MIKLGVDNGNYNTKSSAGMLYASGYAVSDKEFITPEMQLFYEGKYYAIGERRMRFQQDKTKEQDTFILTLPAIAEAMKKAGTTSAEIVLGVGLPIDSYGAQKDAFRRYFLRDNLSFVFEGAVLPLPDRGLQGVRPGARGALPVLSAAEGIPEHHAGGHRRVHRGRSHCS
jgi:plasmid segregation protein ParM